MARLNLFIPSRTDADECIRALGIEDAREQRLVREYCARERARYLNAIARRRRLRGLVIRRWRYARKDLLVAGLLLVGVAAWWVWMIMLTATEVKP